MKKSRDQKYIDGLAESALLLGRTESTGKPLIPYPIRLPKDRLDVLRKNGIDIPAFVRKSISLLANQLDKSSPKASKKKRKGRR